MGSEMKPDFNAEQQTAIESGAKNLLLLAGAGTGKTRTIIGRTLRLLAEGTDPSRLVIVTFTRRAAHEIRSRLAAASAGKGNRILAGTFHHLCLRVMSSRRQWFGYADMTVMDRDDQLQLMRIVRGELVGQNATIPKSASLLNYYSYARNTNQPAKQYLEKFTELDVPTLDMLLKIFAAYKQRKQANSYLDYDDILHRFAKVLHDDPNICRKVCGQYEHVLVDEMQDTNPLQWLILESMSKHCHLFCVGDDAQSIYAFRGADFRNVHSFNERLPNGQTLKLEQNYRSTQPILDLANWLLKQSPLAYDKSLQAVRGDGQRPRLLDFESDFEEAEWIAETIKQRRVQGASWSDHMILCRTAYVARPIEARLIEEKIPYRFVGGIGLLQMAHVRDLLSVLRVVLNPRDELAWMRYLTLWPKIGEVTATKILGKIVEVGSREAAMDALRLALPKRPEIVDVPVAVLEHFDSVPTAIRTAAEQLEDLLEQKYDRWDSRRKDFDLLVRLAGNHRTIQGFLDTYTLDPISATEAERSEIAEDGIVTLITVHSAKGTEADACFVAGAQPGNYPHIHSLGDQDSIEEERRVLYVALTRAQNELYITRSLSSGYSRVSWNASIGSHYFLENIPNKLVERGTRVVPAYKTFDDDDVIG